MNKHIRGGRALILAFGLAGAPFTVDAAAVFAVTEPWVRVSPDARSAQAYMQLRSSVGAKLVDVRSELTSRITLRASGTSRSSSGAIELPPGVTVTLAPGRSHIGLAGLARPLKLGDRVPLVLTIEGADGHRQEIAVSAEVRRRSPTDDHEHAHRH
jgi:copper(I)-binding protein